MSDEKKQEPNLENIDSKIEKLNENLQALHTAQEESTKFLNEDLFKTLTNELKDNFTKQEMHRYNDIVENKEDNKTTVNLEKYKAFIQAGLSKISEAARRPTGDETKRQIVEKNTNNLKGLVPSTGIEEKLQDNFEITGNNDVSYLFDSNNRLTDKGALTLIVLNEETRPWWIVKDGGVLNLTSNLEIIGKMYDLYFTVSGKEDLVEKIDALIKSLNKVTAEPPNVENVEKTSREDRIEALQNIREEINNLNATDENFERVFENKSIEFYDALYVNFPLNKIQGNGTNITFPINEIRGLLGLTEPVPATEESKGRRKGGGERTRKRYRRRRRSGKSRRRRGRSGRSGKSRRRRRHSRHRNKSRRRRH